MAKKRNNKNKEKALQVQESEQNNQNDAQPDDTAGTNGTAARNGKTKEKLEDESAESEDSRMDGEWTIPELIQLGFRVDAFTSKDAIARFICQTAIAFMVLCFILFASMIFYDQQLLGGKYDDTVGFTIFILLMLIGLAIFNAMVASRDYSGLTTFILKFTGLLSISLLAILSVIVLKRNDLLYVICTDTFIRAIQWACIMWWLSVISIFLAYLVTTETITLKLKRKCLAQFAGRWAAIFILLMIVLIFLVDANKFTFMGFHFDQLFFKVAWSVVYMMIISFVSMVYIQVNHGDD